MLTVGLTGGIASGKTLTAAAFTELGVPLLDADEVARAVVAPGTPALAEIGRQFGPGFLLADGQLDRRRMREHVFADRGALRRLEAITHPAIRARLAAWRDAQTAPYCILAVPILFESGMDALVDRALLVDVPEELQVRRLVQRDGIDETLARQMLAAQASRAERRARAHDVIRNDGDPASLRAAVRAMHAHYLALANGGDHAASGLHLP